jgi:FdhD protein
VHKAVAFGAGCLVAVSAPTALAARCAHAAGLTLVGFARAGRLTYYT